MIKYRFQFLILIFFFCFHFNIWSFEFGDLSSKRVLKVVRVDKNYPPLEYIDDNGKLVGWHIDKINKAAKQLHIKVSVESAPFLRAIDMLQKSEVDAMPFLQKNPDREKFLFFEPGNVISKGGYSFAVNKNEPLKFDGDLDTFFSRAKIVGVVQGYVRPESLKLFEKHFEESKDDETLIKKLLGKRYAAIIMTNSTAATIIKNYDKAGHVKLLEPAITSFDIYFAFARKLNKSVAEQKQAKEMAQAFAAAIAK